MKVPSNECEIHHRAIMSDLKGRSVVDTSVVSEIKQVVDKFSPENIHEEDWWKIILYLREKLSKFDWIPVTDSLPAPGRMVITFSPFCDIPVYPAYFNDGIWEDSNNYVLATTEVTHWQPLPEPPSGKF